MFDEFDIDEERQQNIKELQDFLAGALQSTELSEALTSLSTPIDLNSSTKSFKKSNRKRNSDETFHFTGRIPLEKRRSSRLQNVKPEFSYSDLPDEDNKRSYKSEDSDLENLEDVVYRKKRKASSRANQYVHVPVEDITESYLKNIAHQSTRKTYSQSGTSCHQCRQKTIDSKTYCRSGKCIGVRGQFCGPCLRNRYGEDVAVVLLDPNWSCPPCRGLCNCSICRAREGKRPTGILAPIAQRNGHNSVKDFLLSLKGKGDYVNKSDGEDNEDEKSASDDEEEVEEQIKSPVVKIKSLLPIKPKIMNRYRNTKSTFQSFNNNDNKGHHKEHIHDSDSDEYCFGFNEEGPVLNKIDKDEYTVLLGFDEDSKPVLKFL